MSILAKLGPPGLGDVYPRERLFRRLDEASRVPVTWVTGPPGCGKTTLVASYLTARRLRALWYRLDDADSDASTFLHWFCAAAKKAGFTCLPPNLNEDDRADPAVTRLFFRQLFGILPRRLVLAFDDYQQVRPDSRSHRVIEIALAELPEGARVFVLSREDPPASLAEWQASRALKRVGWPDLRLDPEEARGIANLSGAGTSAPVAALLERAEGWAAGLVLLLEEWRQSDPGDGGPPASDGRALGAYLSRVVLAYLDPAARRILLQTSLFPALTASMAAALTGQELAPEILDRLALRRLFVDRLAGEDPGYRFHALLREHLRERAVEELGGKALDELRRRAAGILLKAGQVEESAALSLECGDWEGLARVALAHGISLLSEGRHRLLDSWLTALPDAVLDGDPWLLYLAGACRTFSDPVRGRETLERALSSFRGRGDAAGTFLAWSGIVETYLQRWGDWCPLDRWIDVLDELLTEHPALPSPQVEARVVSSQFMALVLCRPDHPKFEEWERRARGIFEATPGPRERLALGSRLALRFNWCGAQAASSVLVEELRPVADAPETGPLARLLWHFVESMHLWLTAEHKECLATVETGLRLAEESGIHLVDGMLTSMGAYAALLESDLAKAKELLARKRRITDPSRALEHSHVHNLQGWAAMLRGETAKAAEHTEIATRLASGAGVPFIEATFCLSSAHALTELGDLETAAARLERAREVKDRVRSRYLDFAFHLAEAHLAFTREDRETGTEALRKAFVLGRREGYGNTAWWIPDVLARLCARALEEEIEPDYVAELIRRRGLSPRNPPVELESWPWPLRVFTLGRFDVVKNAATVRFSGKAQAKPLELLKVLIALKGRNVPAQQVKAILWPEAIGDSDQHALEMTLHRLRKLLGAAEAVRYSEGKLTLDALHCWVDAWALERLITRQEAMLSGAGRPEHGKVERLLRRILKLYQGPFLAQEGDPWWAAGMQARLKERFTGAVCHAGGFLEDRGAWDSAIAAYQDGLRADALSEELYRRLITGYGKLGRRAEAKAAYRRCQGLFRQVLRTEPSAEIQSALAAALKDRDS